MKKITVTFCDDNSQAVNVSIKEGGRTIRKRISMDSFLKCLFSSSKNEKNYQPIGILPNGYVTGAISANGTKECRVTIQLPAQIRPIIFYDTVYTVPFPALVFYFEAGKAGSVTVSKCYAVKEENMLNETSRLYQYPFGNVYQGNGNICWGNISLPEINKLKDFDQLPEIFFSSSTNDDLWHSGFSGARTQREFLNNLKTMQSFPEDWLIPCNKTAIDLF